MINVCTNPESPITKQDWLEAKKSKEKVKMNKDLMMKAAVQFKGVWPDVDTLEYTYLAVCLKSVWNCREGNIYAVCKDAYTDHWQIFGTREEFEDFVESLFEGAPEGATHYSPEDGHYEQSWWKQDGNEMLCISEEGYIDNWENGWFNEHVELIPRPAKKAEPQAPYMPKVGEECEAKWGITEEWGAVTYVGDFMFFEIHRDKYMKLNISQIENLQFRPLRTEREQFIEQATDDYAKQVLLIDVNQDQLDKIFGALYDASYRKTRD